MSETQPLQDMLNRLHERIAQLEAHLGFKTPARDASSGSSAAPVVELAPRITAYDEYTASFLTPFLAAADKLGEEGKTFGGIVKSAFEGQRTYLLAASMSKKPATSPVPALLAPIQEAIKSVNKLRLKGNEFVNHQKMLAEGIQGLGWLCVEPAPKPFIESYIGGADFWGNKIRVEFKTTKPEHIDFVATFKTLLTELMAYVKEHHTTGVTWNPRGGNVDEFSASSAAPAATPAPVATPAAPKEPKAAAPGAPTGLNALFAGIKSIDQSSGKTAGLRTVTKEQQTWRAEYKAEGAAPAPAPKPTAAKPAAAPAMPTGEPVCELRGGNWYVAYQKDVFTVKDVTMKQQVYIFGCVNATILIEGKAKTIAMDKCVKTKLLFDAAVSAIEIVNCKNVQVQCKQQVPSVAIDKTDGALVYLSYEGRNAQIVTSKSSEMNVAFPASANSEDYIERPIPEQFVHRITDDNTVTSTVSDLYSH
ncbi:hypothetical protein H310_03239 [Aphanomyces invadans]|uniref:C-CAP/cofactor C-like domain-containing protein n=1 Tax=Aphanomyces invadans TaxID=157072 RepID=A0A024UGE9_9STRA|nr:hypothetical protein H310_03239 [Aphanomyces invadans]ETW05476.1 hypothetical protein H310_03239 [Aphanomyces invadans]|eukprot:XP_008865253.1 hypothetical protein H310_03239 [Aphanomyces invadans]